MTPNETWNKSATMSMSLGFEVPTQQSEPHNRAFQFTSNRDALLPHGPNKLGTLLVMNPRPLLLAKQPAPSAHALAQHRLIHAAFVLSLVIAAAVIVPLPLQGVLARIADQDVDAPTRHVLANHADPPGPVD